MAMLKKCDRCKANISWQGVQDPREIRDPILVREVNADTGEKWTVSVHAAGRAGFVTGVDRPDLCADCLWIVVREGHYVDGC